MKRKKDIRRMSDKRLKFWFGESGGTAKLAEDELRRRGLNDAHLRQVMYEYGQGKYTPKGGPYPSPDMLYEEKLIPAESNDPIMGFGKFKGLPLAEVPGWYLEWCYGSFTKGRKRIEKELRSRGFDDEELGYFKKKYPYLSQSPKKQGPKN